MKRTIEVNDVLSERVDSAIEDVKSAILDYAEENESDELPDFNDVDYDGRIHDIIDTAVPIYTHDIKVAMFLYGDEIEQAFDDAGVGTRDDCKEMPLGWEGAAIYCYIEQKVHDWYDESADDVFAEWKEKQAKA